MQSLEFWLVKNQLLWYLKCQSQWVTASLAKMATPLQNGCHFKQLLIFLHTKIMLVWISSICVGFNISWIGKKCILFLCSFFFAYWENEFSQNNARRSIGRSFFLSSGYEAHHKVLLVSVLCSFYHRMSNQHLDFQQNYLPTWFLCF